MSFYLVQAENVVKECSEEQNMQILSKFFKLHWKIYHCNAVCNYIFEVDKKNDMKIKTTCACGESNALKIHENTFKK